MKLNPFRLRTVAVAFSILAVSSFLASCGGNDFTPEVTDINPVAHSLALGEDTRVEVDFKVASSFIGEADAADVIVRIDPELQYVIGSTRFERDPTDRREPDEFKVCPDGRQILVYHIHGNDLEDGSSNSEGFGDNSLPQEFKFHVVGKSRALSTFISAAGNDLGALSADCGRSGPTDEDEEFSVGVG